MGLNLRPVSRLMPSMSSSPASAQENLVVLHDEATRRWLRFQNPVEVLAATRIEDVRPCLREVELAVDQHHLHAAGWISYEAAPAFDPALQTRAPGPLPLLWFGLFEPPAAMELPPPAGPGRPAETWLPEIGPDAYRTAFDRIKQHIRAGDTYQVNLSLRLRCAAPRNRAGNQRRRRLARGLAAGLGLGRKPMKASSSPPSFHQDSPSS